MDEFGFLRTPYREVKKGTPTGEITHLRADEEIRSVLAPMDAMNTSLAIVPEPASGSLALVAGMSLMAMRRRRR